MRVRDALGFQGRFMVTDEGGAWSVPFKGPASLTADGMARWTANGALDKRIDLSGNTITVLDVNGEKDRNHVCALFNTLDGAVNDFTYMKYIDMPGTAKERQAMEGGNLRVARELLRIARRLVTATPHEGEELKIGSFYMREGKLRSGTMSYPGSFYFVSGPFKDMQFVKDALKRLGMRYDGATQSWRVYWKDGNWNAIKGVLDDYVAKTQQAAAETDLQPDDEFEMNLVVKWVGDSFEPNYGNMNLNVTMDQAYAITHPEEYGRRRTIKRRVILKDGSSNNSYITNVSSRQRAGGAAGKFFRDNFDNPDEMIGKTVHIVGKVVSVKPSMGGNDITFNII